MSNKIILKKSSVGDKVPQSGDLEYGELALNYNDGNLFYKNSSNAITTIASNKFVSVTGNVVGGNLNTAGDVSATGTIVGGNISTVGNISSNKINAANLSLSGNVLSAINTTSNITTTANVLGNNVNAANLSLSGNVLSAINTTSNITTTANISGANVIGTIVGGTISGSTISGSGNVTGGNITTAGAVSATGAVNAGSVSTAGNITGANINGGANVFATTHTGTTVLVTGNVTGGNIVTAGLVSAGNIQTTGTISAAGTATVGNVSTSGTVSAAGNVTGANIVTGGLVTATGNVNTSSSVSASGNIRGGNILTTGVVSASSNVIGGNINTGGSVSAVGSGTFGAGLNVVGNITVSGNINYENVTDLVVGDPLIYLGANNTTDLVDLGFVASYNDGTYKHTGLARNYTDDTWTFYDGVVAEPTTVIDWANATYPTVKMGATQVTTTMSAAGNITGGNLLTAGLISATGTITGNQFNGSGAGLTTLNASNISSGTLASARLSGSYNISVTSANTATTAGTVTTNAQPNITSVGTLTSVSVSGNVQGGNLRTAGLISATGQITGSQFNGSGAGLTAIPGGNVSGTVASATSATTAGTVTGNAQANITSVGTLTSLSVSGAVTADSFSGNGAALSNVSATRTVIYDVTDNATYNLALIAQSGSPSNVSRQNTGLTFNPSTLDFSVGSISGTFSPWLVNVRATTNATSTATGAVRVQGGVGVVGNVYAGAFYGAATGLTSIPGGNVSGTVANATYATSAGSAGTATSATTAGTVTTNAQANITSVGTLTSLSVSGNVQGGNLRTAGLISATGTITGNQFNGSGAGLTTLNASNISSGTLASARLSGSYSISVTSATTAGTVTTAAQPNITSVGTLSSLTVSGAITVNSGNNATAIVNGGSNGVGNIGSATTYFNTVFAKATSAQYADLAEKYLADAEYEPGTVLSFGGTEEVTQSNEPADHRVVGVVTTSPAYVMNAGLEGQNVVCIALIGRVPTKVTGTIHKGDFIVSAGNGYATASSTPSLGTVLGKAIEDFSGESGTIEVLVGRI